MIERHLLENVQRINKSHITSCLLMVIENINHWMNKEFKVFKELSIEANKRTVMSFEKKLFYYAVEWHFWYSRVNASQRIC